MAWTDVRDDLDAYATATMADYAALSAEFKAGMWTVIGKTVWDYVGGGGPATQLDADGTILDVNAITDGQYLKRTGTTIVSDAGPAGAVASVFGRVGAVTAQAGDYTAGDVGAQPADAGLASLVAADTGFGIAYPTGANTWGLLSCAGIGDALKVPRVNAAGNGLEWLTLGAAAYLAVGTGAGDVAAGDAPAAAVSTHDDLAANPHLTHLRCHEHFARWDTTDIITPWGPTPSPVGTASAVRDSDGMWRRATSASGAGNKAAMLTNADLCEGQALVEAWFDFRTGSDLTNCAWWVGVYVGTTLPTQSATYTQEHLMLRRVAGTDTNWQVSRYQSSQTLTDTGVAGAASTHYAVRIRQAAGTWRITLYTVSGRTYTQVYDLDSLTTEIPQAASRLRHHCGLIVDSSVTRVADWKSTRLWGL